MSHAQKSDDLPIRGYSASSRCIYTRRGNSPELRAWYSVVCTLAHYRAKWSKVYQIFMVRVHRVHCCNLFLGDFYILRHEKRYWAATVRKSVMVSWNVYKAPRLDSS